MFDLGCQLHGFIVTAWSNVWKRILMCSSCWDQLAVSAVGQGVRRSVFAVSVFIV